MEWSISLFFLLIWCSFPNNQLLINWYSSLGPPFSLRPYHKTTGEADVTQVTLWKKELSSLWTLGDHILMHTWQWDTGLHLRSTETKMRAWELGERNLRQEESNEGRRQRTEASSFHCSLSASKYRPTFQKEYTYARISYGISSSHFFQISFKKKKNNSIITYHKM